MNSILIYVFVIPVLSVVLLSVNFIFAPHKPYKEKKTPFECGYHSFSQTRSQFSVSFFIVAILFSIFDIELVLVFPIGVSIYFNSIYGLSIAIAFLLILGLGFMFELGKNALKIETKQETNQFITRSLESKNSINIVTIITFIILYVSFRGPISFLGRIISDDFMYLVPFVSSVAVILSNIILSGFKGEQVCFKNLGKLSIFALLISGTIVIILSMLEFCLGYKPLSVLTNISLGFISGAFAWISQHHNNIMESVRELAKIFININGSGGDTAKIGGPKDSGKLDSPVKEINTHTTTMDNNDPWEGSSKDVDDKVIEDAWERFVNEDYCEESSKATRKESPKQPEPETKTKKNSSDDWQVSEEKFFERVRKDFNLVAFPLPSEEHFGSDYHGFPTYESYKEFCERERAKIKAELDARRQREDSRSLGHVKQNLKGHKTQLEKLFKDAVEWKSIDEPQVIKNFRDRALTQLKIEEENRYIFEDEQEKQKKREVIESNKRAREEVQRQRDAKKAQKRMEIEARVAERYDREVREDAAEQERLREFYDRVDERVQREETGKGKGKGKEREE